MRILAITLPEFEQQARQIAGPDADVLVAGGSILVWPSRARYDLVLIWLHPSADGRAWVDGEGREVLDVVQMRDLPLDSAVVFVGACWAVESDPMIGALFEAGARAVIAGPGENYGGADGFVGADVLALTFRQALGVGVPLGAAWTLARAATRLAGLRGALGVEDALEYRIRAGEDENGAGDSGGCLNRIALAIAAAISIVVLLMMGLASDLITFDSPISPIATDTPVATWTMAYTPGGWQQQEAAYTATPCLDCYPTPAGARIPYDIYLPLVMNNYQATEWALLIEVDGVTVDRSVTATIGMTSTITATNQIVHYASEAATHTLTIEIDQLTMTGYDVGFGSIVTDTGILTWTMSMSPSTLAELETYYTPITTTAYLTATFGGTDKTVTLDSQ
jgi:hypothetical protein